LVGPRPWYVVAYTAFRDSRSLRKRGHNIITRTAIVEQASSIIIRVASCLLALLPFET